MSKKYFYHISISICLLCFFCEAPFLQTVIEGNISTNTVWGISGSPYILQNEVVLEAGATLEIEPGVVVNVGSYGQSFIIQGDLLAVGTETERITFSGEIGGAYFYSGSIQITGGSTDLAYVNFAGLAGATGFVNQLQVTAGTVSLEHCRFVNGEGFGVVVSDGAGFTGRHNFFATVSEGYTAYLATPHASEAMVIEDNIYDGSMGAIKVYGELGDGETVNWFPKEVPYSPLYFGYSGIAGELNIMPGTEVAFDEEGVLYVINGRVNALGTEENPIVFTGNYFDQNDQWGGIVLYSLFVENTSQFEHCIFKNMASGILGVSYFSQQTSFSLTDSRFDNIGEDAIYLSNVQPVIKNNCFSNIYGDAINNEGSNLIDAKANYFGHPSGPFHSNNPNGEGESITGNVDFSDFLATCPNQEIIDLALGQLISPDISCQTGEDLPIIIEVKNEGPTAQSGFSLAIKINGVSYPTEQVNNISIPGFGSFEHTFAPTIDVTHFEQNEIEITLSFNPDQNPGNNHQVFSFTSIPFNASTSGDRQTCPGDFVTLYAFGGENYQWSNGSNSNFISVNPTSDQSYTVTVTNAAGCTDVDSILVEMYELPLPAEITATSSVVCEGSSVTLHSDLSGNIFWYPAGQTTSSIEVTYAGTFYVYYVSPEGCEVWSDPFQVMQADKPYVEAAGDGVICSNSSETLTVYGASQYLWSNQGETTQSITVSPSQSTVYSVTATNNYGCSYVLEIPVFVLSNDTPDVVKNLLPPTGTANVPYPVQLSWGAAENASGYDLYLWKTGDMIPDNPTYTVSGLSKNVSYPAVSFGNSYHWRVNGVNGCTGEKGPKSDIYTFTLVHLPDVVVDMVQVPDTVFSGTEIEVAWTARNYGHGGTGNSIWMDAVYLSLDDEIGFGDIYLGVIERQSALAANNGFYSSSLVANLPIGTYGDYCILVKADPYNYLPETDNENNVSACGNIHIELTPPPDLVVVDNISLSGVAGNTTSQGAEIGISWEVENRNHGAAGKTISGHWYDRVFINALDTLNHSTAKLLATVAHQGNLEVGDKYTGNATVEIPDHYLGEYYIFVCTDDTNQEYEHIYENNNCRMHGPVSVLQSPKPDFTINDVSVSNNTLSNGEGLTVQWSDRNDGASFAGNLTDKIFLSKTPNMDSVISVLGSSIGNVFMPNSDSTVSREKTVYLPVDRSGDFYILVKTNSDNIVENDFSINIAAVPIKILPVNLVLNNIEVPSSGISGNIISIKWTVENEGPGNVLSRPLSDRVYFFDNADGTGNPILIKEKNNTETIFAGNEKERNLNIIFPAGTEDTLWVGVRTNNDEAIVENGNFIDNYSMHPQPIIISNGKHPNLTALEINSDATNVFPGDIVHVNYFVKNNGDTVALGNWKDKIYLSTSPNVLTNSILVKTLPQSQILPENASYFREANFPIPNNLQNDTYYLCIQTDANDNIFELGIENDNIICSSAINVLQLPNVDLQLVSATIEGDLTPGSLATLTWTVRNNGDTPTLIDNWNEVLYFSQDDLLTPSDTQVITWQHTGILESGGTYTRSENFTMPFGFSGIYYLFIKTDSEEKTVDFDFANNHKKIGQAGTGNDILIDFPELPDLSVEIISAPVQVIVGQPVSVIYKVKNNSGSMTPPFWSDAVYLNNSLIIQGLPLGQKVNAQQLDAGGEYLDTIEFTVPASLAGNYILHMSTDAANSVAETIENNNSAYTGIVINVSGLVDLTVKNVVAPAQATISSEVEVTWQVQNIGLDQLAGHMEQTVVISNDTIWDAADVLLGTWAGHVDLAPGGSVNHQLSVCISAVKNEPYYFLVKTDILNSFPEINENNNCASTPVTTIIDIPELPIGMVTSDVLQVEKPIFYHIEVPDNLAGSTMRVTLQSDNGLAVNELYLRAGEIPTRFEFDFSFDQPFAADQEIWVPALATGTYYLMAYGVTGEPVQGIGLLAEIVPFQVSSILANRGGNTGSTTVKLEGAQFVHGMTVWLENDNGNFIQGHNLLVISATEAYVAFPLENEELGPYDVYAHDGTDEVHLVNGFEVVPGVIEVIPELSCSTGPSVGVLSVLDATATTAVVTYLHDYPSAVRPNEVFKINLRIRNTGNVDIPIPKRVFRSVSEVPMSNHAGGFSAGITAFTVDFYEQNGPPDILRPGAESTRTVYVKVTKSSGVLKFVLEKI